eukprot:3293265-Prymnesium_polylepis.2
MPRRRHVDHARRRGLDAYPGAAVAPVRPAGHVEDARPVSSRARLAGFRTCIDTTAMSRCQAPPRAQPAICFD